MGDNMQYADTVGLDTIATEAARTELVNLMIPTAPDDLTPRPFPYGVACAPANEGVRGRNTGPNCDPNVIPGERIVTMGAFKTPNLRNVKFTGPYMHNGGKMNLRQVVEFYKQGGDFPNLNLANIADVLGPFELGLDDEAALVEFIETGLTDWNLAYQENQFDHPQICVPHGHNSDGSDNLVEIAAVGQDGGPMLQTFEEQLNNITTDRAHTHATGSCTMGM